MKTIFIDRAREIKVVRDALSSRRNRIVILLGEGGIGKTRFLQETQKIVEKDYKNIRMLIWWDFDEYIQKDRPDFYIKNKFLESTGLLKKILDPHGISPNEIAQEINRTAKRKLLLFDTLEKLNDPRMKSGLFELFSSLDNSAFIFAGRAPKDKQGKIEFDDFIKQGKRIDPNLKIITLNPFDQKSALEYISQKARFRRVFISNHDKKKLANLSRGVPILLDLATDYIANNIQIPHLTEKVSDKNFEKVLVEQIIKLKSPLDLAVLILSVVNPLGVSSLAKGLNVRNAEGLFQKLKSLSFVKVLPDGQVILHDKMEDLIVQYIWNSDAYRPTKKFRERIYKKAFEFFKKWDQELAVQRSKLKKQINVKNISSRDLATLTYTLDTVTRKRELATQRWVRFGLAIDVKSLWSDYVKLIRDVRTGNKFEFIQKLVDEMNTTITSDVEPYQKALTQEQLYEFELISARSKKDLGDLDNAIRDLESMLVKYGGKSNKRNQILNLLASTQTQMGHLKYLRKAIQNHTECLQFIVSNYSKSHDPRSLLDIARTENQIAYTYRLLEDDTVNARQHAVEHYLKGRDFALEYKEYLDDKLSSEVARDKKIAIRREINSAKRTLAAINNGLGYVQGLQGLYDDAYFQIENAVSVWKETGDFREIARAKTSEAILKRDQGKFEESATLFEEALQLPYAKDDHLNLCRIYHHKGWNEWELASKYGFETEQGLTLLEQAYLSLELSIKSIGTDANYVRELSGIYHNISEMMWKLGQIYKKRGLHEIGIQMLSDARKNNHLAIRLSEESNNRRYLIDALVGEAQYDFDDKNFKRINQLFNKVKKFERRFPQFGLFYGRMYRIKGDVLYLERNFDEAFEMYSKAYPLIYKSKSGEGSYGFTDEQKTLKDKIDKLAPRMARKYYEYLRSAWRKKKEDSKLITWCDNEIYRLRMAE